MKGYLGGCFLFGIDGMVYTADNQNMNQCPDCKGQLEKGCLIDQTYGAVTVQRYARADVPDTGNKAIMGVSEEKFYDLRKTMAYRCTNCGRLFLYALNTVTIPDLSTRMKKFWIILGLVMGAMLIIGFLAAFFR